MLKKIIGAIGGDPNEKIIEEYRQVALQINDLEPEFEALSDDQLSAKTGEFKARLAQGQTLDDILPEAFAAVREVSKRQLGQRHYDVQLIGGMILHDGKVAEMRTGEGKTLMSTLPIYLNALTGRGVHLITVNDYLARRDARWMAPIFNTLGLSVGVLQMGSRTEGGKKAFLVDLERENQKDESNHQLVLVDRVEAYAADITYGTNNEFGFDYLRDNMRNSLDERSQRGHYYAIIDEVDNVLIDEARTPLIISGPSHDDAENYQRMAEVVKNLRPGDYEVNEKDRNVVLTELGEMRVEQMLNTPLRDPDRPEDVTPEQARMFGYLEQALRAQFLYKRNKDYMVQGRQVVIVDEFTGRLMPGRRWSDGLHQAVEAKENVPVRAENITHATITIQNYFRMYEKLSGMTGTAITEAEEFDNIYKLEVVAVPPHVEYLAIGEDSLLLSNKAKDEYGYEYTYYTFRNDEEQQAVFFRRKDYPDVVYRTQEAKLRAIVTEIIQYHIIGRPTLVGTTSVEASERLSKRLRTNMVTRLLQVLLLRKTWFEVNNREEDGRTVMALSFLNEPLDTLKTGELNRLAKELDVSLNLNNAEIVERLLTYLDLGPEHKDGLLQVLKSGVSHQVLNARKHTEESRTIEKAGAPGTVTIATNMAGRGVDIKLGGKLGDEYAEERINLEVVKLLRELGHKDPYNMSIEERYQVLKDVDLSDLRLTQSRLINEFLTYIEEMEKVKELGGLHVIGSERHEARRIDNQLRGRAARQGDPGSSRFFLSMQDDLMRLFGGQQVEGMMERLGMDDALPLEARIVSNIIESSQTRVEGANFDTRKHLLEYDDVLNAQRESIYNQRDRIFVKDDLTEDVREMLETELSRRIPEALQDPDGPWKLLGWLESVQPPMQLDSILYPSFTVKLLLDQVNELDSRPFLEIAEASMAAEEEHLLEGVQATVSAVQDRLQIQVEERRDALEMFFDTLSYADPAELGSPKQIAEELQASLGIPINLSSQEQRLLTEDTTQVQELIQEQLHTFLYQSSVTRLIAAIERRLGLSLGLNANQLADQEWDQIAAAIIGAVQANFDGRRQQLLGNGSDGQLARELQGAFSRMPGPLNDQTRAQLLLGMTQGEATAFDKRTHRQVKVRINRLNYVYYAASLLENANPAELTEQVLAHMDRVFEGIKHNWGTAVWDQAQESTLESLEEGIQKDFSREFGEQIYQDNLSQKLSALPEEQQQWMITEIGKRGVTETYRRLILSVISQLWVEYLTQMEALRVSIGLEAYAQRDPLVQYKAQASEMFQQLFSDMRMGVISRMFALRPRQAAVQRQTEAIVPEVEEPQDEQPEAPQQGQQGTSDSDNGKRKRKRKRKKK